MNSTGLLWLMMDTHMSLEDIIAGLVYELLELEKELEKEHQEVIKTALEFRYQVLLGTLEQIHSMSEKELH